MFSLFAAKAEAEAAAELIVSADLPESSAMLSTAANGNASLSNLQSMAAAGAKFGTKDILSIAAAKQAALNASLSSLNAMTVEGTSGTVNVQAISRSVSVDGAKKLAPTTEEWVSLATISHVEVSK